MRDFTEIDRLTKELESSMSAYLIARKALKWTGYITDQAMVSRKLMALDHAIMKLSALIPDEFIGGDVETPQEYAASVATVLKAEHVMMGKPA